MVPSYLTMCLFIRSLQMYVYIPHNKKSKLYRYHKIQPFIPAMEEQYRTFLGDDTWRESGVPQTAAVSGRTLGICETTDEEAFAGLRAWGMRLVTRHLSV
jgi:hypothetical protein